MNTPRRFAPRILITLTLVFAASSAAEPRETVRAKPAVVEDGISVYFSPRSGCEGAIIDQIAAAKQSVDIQAYSFTNVNIAEAVSAAKKRGVKIRMILDEEATGEKYSAATFFKNRKITVHTDGKHQIAHNKVMIIDRKTVITGSFNFTVQAEISNAENVLVIENHPKIAAAYLANFEEHFDHSEKYKGVAPREDNRGK